MFKFRSEASTYKRACEYLISVATMRGNEKLTADECQVIDYYAAELSKITEPFEPCKAKTGASAESEPVVAAASAAFRR